MSKDNVIQFPKKNIREVKIKDIAKKFDLNTGHVGKICRYQIWKL